MMISHPAAETRTSSCSIDVIVSAAFLNVRLKNLPLASKNACIPGLRGSRGQISSAARAISDAV